MRISERTQQTPISTALLLIAPALVGREIDVLMGAPRKYQGVERDNPVGFEEVPGQPPVNLTAVPASAAGSASAPPSLSNVGATTAPTAAGTAAPPAIPSF